MIVNKKVKGVIQMKFSICTIYLVCGNTYVSTWTVLGVFLIFFFFPKCAAPKRGNGDVCSKTKKPRDG